MNYSIHSLFILCLLIFISDVFTCKCTFGQAIGTYCGGELKKTDGGSDCGLDILWSCSVKYGEAVKSEICKFGCCGKPGIASFCCNDSECLGCSQNLYKQPMSASASASENSPTTQISKSSPTQISESSPTQIDESSPTQIDENSSDSNVEAIIIGSVIGGVTTIIAAVVAAVIGIKCKKRQN